jgi:hypothetical protein
LKRKDIGQAEEFHRRGEPCRREAPRAAFVSLHRRPGDAERFGELRLARADQQPRLAQPLADLHIHVPAAATRLAARRPAAFDRANSGPIHAGAPASTKTSRQSYRRPAGPAMKSGDWSV